MSYFRKNKTIPMLSEVFQFIPADTPRAIKEISNNATIIFDLEDSLKDVTNDKRTEFLKENGRLKLKESLINHATVIDKKIGIRINTIKGNEFKSDLKFLCELSNHINWQYILLPKIEDREIINQYESVFNEFNIRYKGLIPIIETVKGVENVPIILSTPPSFKINKAIWGHFDFNLDGHYWPFIDQKNIIYWEITQKLISQFKQYKYEYINGGFLELGNDLSFVKIVSAIEKLCNNINWSQVTISYNQTKIITSLTDIKPIDYTELIENSILIESEKVNLAKRIVHLFNEYKLSDKSFSVDKINKIMITPHQYIAAIRYLSQNE